MNEILSVKNITVAYGELVAVKNVSLELREEEIITLIGSNGAGKSTILKAIIGLLPVKEGEILFNNKIIHSASIRTSPDELLKAGIALVPEGRKIFGELTVKENLEMGAFIIKEKKKIEDRLEFIYSLFPILKDRSRQKAGLLSGGEQQMLAISRALMSYPKLLLLDEPSLGLAPMVVREIFSVLSEINHKEKVSIILVEQNAKLALKFSNRGYVVETGSIVLSDSSKNLLENQKVKSAYLGER
ncbi:MAG: ABC transporter ATP-binding protein [Brevinematales bacterium]|nr:ABC transporter ATP-binding protein [Brevinematales bacterium]